MGTKFEQFEESTKITSSSEIDEILKQARSAPALDDDDDDDDVGDFEERTQIGNVKELVARSMTIEDPTPPAPVIGRASTNVIRRAATPLPVRTSEQMPVVRAQGSLSDITPSDDAAFDPWDEQPVASASQPMVAIQQEPEIEVAPLPLPTAMPMAMAMEVAPVTIAPPIVAPMISLPAPAPTKMRWGAVAWVCLLALMIGVGTVGYLKIRQLEGELAQAKAALKQR